MNGLLHTDFRMKLGHGTHTPCSPSPAPPRMRAPAFTSSTAPPPPFKCSTHTTAHPTPLQVLHAHALPTPPKVPHLFTQLLPPRPPAFGVSVLPSCLEVQQYGGTSYSHSRYDNFLPRTTATGEPLGYEGSTLKVRPCLLLHATAPPAPATAPTFCLPAVAAAILSAHVPLTRLMPTAYCLLTNCLLTTAY